MTRNRVPHWVIDSVRRLYVKALKAANNEPTETLEIQTIWNKLYAWMIGE